MAGFWNRQNETRELEAALRVARAEPPAELIDRVSAQVQGSRPRPESRSSLRVGLAAGLSTLMLGVLASFGGLEYAVAAAKQAADTTVDTFSGSGGSQVQHTPAEDEYRPGCGRGDKNHIHEGPPSDNDRFDPDQCPPEAPPPVNPPPP